MIPHEERSMDLGEWQPELFFRNQKICWLERVICNYDIEEIAIEEENGRIFKKVRFASIQYLEGVIQDPVSGDFIGISHKIPGAPGFVSKSIEVLSTKLADLVTVEAKGGSI